MHPRFGFWTLTFLVIANMIGAGVFTTSGYSLESLHSQHYVIAAWVVGGAIAIAGAYSYGMLVAVMPESGGEYLFLSRAAHPLLGFIAGWVSLIAGFSGAIAFAATSLEEYALPDRLRPEWIPNGAIAILSIVLAGTLHGWSPRAGAWTQNAVVILKIGLLAAILLFASGQLANDNWQGEQPIPAPLKGLRLAVAFAGSLVWISLSYSGFNAGVYIAGEVRDAKRVVPKALVTGTAIVVVLYLLLNSVFVYAPSLESIAGKSDVAAIAARALGGNAFEAFVRWTIVLCLLTSVFSMMMAAPRVYAKMADDGLLPSFLRFRADRPRAATQMQVAIAVLLVMSTTLLGLLSYLGLTLSITAASTVACLFLPSVRTKPLLHPIHLLPAFYVVCTLIAAAMLISFNPWEVLGTIITFAVGAAAYVFVQYLSRSAAGQ